MKKNIIQCIIFLIIGLSIGAYGARKIFEREILNLQYGKLLSVLNCVEKNYVDTVNSKKLEEESISCILEQLDPHSTYVPASSAQVVQEPLNGNFGGIGVTFNMLLDTIVVINTIKGGPSEKIGIMAGDRILKINDSLVAGRKIKQDSIMKLLRGPKGTTVHIAVSRGGSDELLPFDIERDEIPIKSIDVAYMIKPHTGYIKLSTFSANTFSEFKKAISKFEEKGLESLIIDLRNNSGGYLYQSVELLNEFLPKDAMIVYTKKREKIDGKIKADGKGKLQDIKLTILVDETSASASEIMAGAIQDNDRGTIIGRRTFGKGLVQESISFADGSMLRLTVSKYYTASGKTIQRPYGLGNNEYYLDIYQRYLHGELETIDSIKKDTTETFSTIKGRKVYSGGVTPDIFIPLDTTLGKNDFLKFCNRKNLIYKFSLDYSDKNRTILQKTKTISDLDKFFANNNYWRDFLVYAKQQGAPMKEAYINAVQFIMGMQLKAIIGRGTMLDDVAFYYYLNQYDTTINAALNNANQVSPI